MSWKPGKYAQTHDVYFGTVFEDVNNAGRSNPLNILVSQNQQATTYDPGILNFGQTYFWRVDEVNSVETPTTLDGNLWSFTAQRFLIVDDFEDYNDYSPHEIYSTWQDGYQNSANGSQVGYLTPPTIEMAIVHGGKQSMPLLYSNTSGATYSEVEHGFTSPQDWTKHSIKTLVLYFFGTPGNTGQLYVKVNGTKALYAGAAADIARPIWKQWNINLASLGIALTNVTKLAIGIDGNGAAGTLYVDDIRLYAAAPALPSEEIWLEAEAADTITPPMQVFSAIPGASGGIT